MEQQTKLPKVVGEGEQEEDGKRDRWRKKEEGRDSERRKGKGRAEIEGRDF